MKNSGTCILEVLCSNLNRYSSYPDWGFAYFVSISSCIYRKKYPDYTTFDFFQILSNS
jgi:hypothetical protein